MRKKLYDPVSDCLLYIDREADEEFWDEKWEKLAKATYANPPRHGMTINITRRYLPSGSRLLEGGCGLGDVVYALNKAGYNVDGIDYAPKVVDAINKNWPHLNVTLGDVRHISSTDDFYDGYWSFGVIEHFSDGYESIAKEMQRVIRPSGYLFLSFPSFNQFRRTRAVAGKYDRYTTAPTKMPEFYQFALDPSKVQADFEAQGFELVECRGIGALQTFAEDTNLGASVQRLLNYLPSRVGTAVSMAIDLLVGRYAGHSSLLILRKK